MKRYDEELAALLALDALDAVDIADAEAELNGAAADLQRVSAALAETAATPPPDDLRAEVMHAAIGRREPGNPVGGVAPCPPAEAFGRTVADFYAVLISLTGEEWLEPAHEAHGRVRDLVAHLVGVERLSERWLDPDHEAPLVLDHVAATRPVIQELADLDGPALAGAWHEAVLSVAAAAAAGDPHRRVMFHDMATDVGGFLVTRTFELWAHAMDISLATGRPLLDLDDERMRLLSSRLMTAVPAAMALRGSSVPGATVRFVLTGPAGGCYDVPLGSSKATRMPASTIVADVVDVCRVAARRLAARNLPAAIEGDDMLAWRVVATLDAFARD
jgi:Mycothiol maleylpyruvate isomerase N-terminal domain